MKKYFFLLICISFLFKSYGNEIVIKKIPTAWFSSQTKAIEMYMGRRVDMIETMGELSIGGNMIKTPPRFLITKPIPWKFEFTLSRADSSIIYNLNHNTDWYIRRSGSKAWRKIEAEHISLSPGITYEIRIECHGRKSVFGSRHPVMPVPFNGMTTPVFTTKAHQYRLIESSLHPNRHWILKFTLPKRVAWKSLKEIIEFNGTLIPKIYKRLNRDTLTLTIPLPDALKENPDASVHVRVFEDNEILVDKIMPGLPVSFRYAPPAILRNGENHAFLGFHFVPDLHYPAITMEPELQSRIFRQVAKRGYNTVITELNNLSPTLVYNAWKQGLDIIVMVDDLQMASSILQEEWLHFAPNVMIDVQNPATAELPSRFFSWKHVVIRNDLWELNDSDSHPPLYEVSWFSPHSISRLVDRLNQYGGMLCHPGYFTPLQDELPNPPELKQEMTSLINRIKQTNPGTLSGCFNSLTPFEVSFPISAWHKTQFVKFPYPLLENGKKISEDSGYFIELLKSPIPLQFRLPQRTSGNDILFIVVGLINFFLFLIYFIRLRSFSYYLTRSTKNSHGFFIDLHEKIAVPWSESLMLLLFSAVGFGVSVGAYFYFYKNYIILGHWLNVILVNPDATRLVLMWLQSPVRLIISLSLFYIFYIGLLGFSLRFVAYIFKAKIRIRYALALSIWSHAWAFIFTLIGFVAYRSFLLIHINMEFWALLLVIFVLGYMRFNKGIFLSMAMKKTQIYFISLIILGILFLILYFGGYPFGQTVSQINELIRN